MQQAVMKPALLLLGLLSASTDVPPLEPDSFDALAARIAPARVEPWQTLPWRLDLLEARAEARASERPLFLWSMNGHPLGCT